MDRTREGSIERLALDLFLDAREIESEQRRAFLEKACDGDAGLRERVEALLATDEMSLHLSAVAEEAALSLLGDSTAAVGREVVGVLPRSPQDELEKQEVPAVEGYRIVGELGAGGMGTVYLAYSIDLRRQVALKVVRGAGRQLGRRFLEEAQVLAQLQHPNIVPVLDFGLTSNHQPYYTMPVLRGRTLGEILQERSSNDAGKGRGFTLTRLLQILLQVTQAVAYSHAKGVIHRDLKPANIMLGEHGEVQLLDWGLSKVVSRPEEGRTETEFPELRGGGSDLTRHGMVLGTIGYMSPEQARGETQNLTESADVYSLGAILYEILAGEPPVASADGRAALDLVAEGRIEWPRERFPDRYLSRELDAVTRRAMALEPSDRHPGAAALAADISAFLEGKLLKGVEYGLLEPLRKWVNRNRALSGAVATALLVLLTVVSVFVWNLSVERKRAEDSLALSRYSEILALAEADRLPEASDLLDSLEAADREDVLAPLALPATRWALTQEGHDVEILTLVGHTDTVSSVAFLPDGRRAVSAGRDGTLRIWDVRAGVPLQSLDAQAAVMDLAVSQDGGRALTSGADGMLRLWDLQLGEEIWSHAECAAACDGGPVALVAAGGAMLGLSARGGVNLWDLTRGELIRSLSIRTGEPGSLAFSPDGRRLALGQDKTGPKRVASWSVWDVKTGQLLQIREAHRDIIRFTAFSPDGRSLFTGAEDRQLKKWDPETGELLRTFSGHRRGIKDGAVSPDGRWLLSGSFDQTMRVWDVESGEQIRRFSGHQAQVNGVAISADGRFALTASWDGNLKLWRLEEDRLERKVNGEAVQGGPLALSLDGRRILYGMEPKLWDIGSGKVLGSLPVQDTWAIALLPDGRHAVTGGRNGMLRLWDLLSEQEIWSSQVPDGPVLILFLPPGGGEVWSVGRDAMLMRWDLTRGDLRGARTLPFEVPDPIRCFLSPDGRHALTWREGMQELWDLQKVEKAWSVPVGLGAVKATFSADGESILTGADLSGNLVLLDRRSGERLWDIARPGWSLGALSLSPDERHALVVSGLGLSLIDLRDGGEVRAFRSDMLNVADVAFLPRGSAFLMAGGDIHLWDLGFSEQLPAHRRKVRQARDRLMGSPGEPGALNTLGEYYAFRGVNDWALEFLERAEQAGHQVSLDLLANLYWQLGRPQEAAEWFARALQDASGEGRLHLELSLRAARKEAAAIPAAESSGAGLDGRPAGFRPGSRAEGTPADATAPPGSPPA